MHLSQRKLCTRKMELALEVKFHLEFHWVTRPWRRTLANGRDVEDEFPRCRIHVTCDDVSDVMDSDVQCVTSSVTSRFTYSKMEGRPAAVPFDVDIGAAPDQCNHGGAVVFTRSEVKRRVHVIVGNICGRIVENLNTNSSSKHWINRKYRIVLCSP